MHELIALVDEESDLLFGESAASVRLLSQVERVAGTPRTTVLVLGERGREVELVARAIHARSKPALEGLKGTTFEQRGPFHRVACAALSAQNSSVSGGSGFSDANGLFERATHGTLFFDEIADLGPRDQGQLLEVLERRAAESPPLRVVASTARELENEVEGGRFRADLFYRLNVLTIRVPTLVDRIDDVPELSLAVLRRIQSLLGVGTTISVDALEALTLYEWPGNLFELESVLRQAALAVQGGQIEAEHLRLGAGNQGELTPIRAEGRSLRRIEEAAIRRVLIEEGGNRSRAARTLGINRTTLYNKLRQYGIA